MFLVAVAFDLAPSVAWCASPPPPRRITTHPPSRRLQAYFGEGFDEDAIRNHFTLVYELMDETMDFGYPQNCAIEVLRQYINLGTVQQVP